MLLFVNKKNTYIKVILKLDDRLTLVAWERSLLWEATCTDALAPSLVREIVLSAGTAMEKAETNKRH